MMPWAPIAGEDFLSPSATAIGKFFYGKRGQIGCEAEHHSERDSAESSSNERR